MALSQQRPLTAPATAFSAAPPPGRGPESPLAKFLIGGGVTIAFEMSGGHFVEFLKIAKQTSPNESYLAIAKRVTSKKGFAGTLDGFFPWGAIQALAKGSVFSWGQAVSAKAMHSSSALSKEQKTVISGGVGGFVQGLAMSPLLLLKTRVMTDPSFRATGGLLATAAASARVGARVVSSEGPGALFKGVGLFSVKRAADWTSRYLFVVLLEELMKKDKPEDTRLSEGQKAVASLGGGALSALATIPMDVLVALKMQAGSAGKKVGVLDTFKEQIRAGGLGPTLAFATRGLGARIVHVSATTYMMKVLTTAVYDLLYPAK